MEDSFVLTLYGTIGTILNIEQSIILPFSTMHEFNQLIFFWLSIIKIFILFHRISKKTTTQVYLKMQVQLSFAFFLLLLERQHRNMKSVTLFDKTVSEIYALYMPFYCLFNLLPVNSKLQKFTIGNETVNGKSELLILLSKSS